MIPDAKTLTRPFFVYGTLLTGQPNYHLWRDSVAEVVPAIMEDAALFDCGPFPLLARRGGGRVKGELVWVKAAGYMAVLQRLDTLEGYDPAAPDKALFQRLTRTAVCLARDRQVRAWVYAGSAASTLGLPLIPGGDWAAHTAARQQQLAAWWRDVAGLNDLADDASGGASTS